MGDALKPFTGHPVLVTGAEGFIGSHLCEALVRAGNRVRAFVLYNSFGHQGWLEDLPPEVRREIEVFTGDVRDPNGVAESMRGVDTVFHLAALIGIPYSYHSPDTYVDTNVRGTLNVLQAARAGGIRVLQTSTSEVYGTAVTVPMTEEHPLNAQSPYAATKIGADQMALSFHRSFGMPVTVVRPFNTYGPRQSARAVIPTVLTQLLAGAPSIRVGATEPRRDFSFVEDTAAGFVAIAAAGSATDGEVLHLGSGFEISVGDMIALAAEALGKDARVEREAQRVRPEKSEVDRLLCDASKTTRLTGWAPRHTGRDGLRRGLLSTAEWLKKPKNAAWYRVGEYAI